MVLLPLQMSFMDQLSVFFNGKAMRLLIDFLARCPHETDYHWLKLNELAYPTKNAAVYHLI